MPLPGLCSALGAKRASLCSLDGADSNFCPFLPLTMSEAARKVAQETGIGCLQRCQSFGTLSVIRQPPGTRSRVAMTNDGGAAHLRRSGGGGRR